MSVRIGGELLHDEEKVLLLQESSLDKHVITGKLFKASFACLRSRSISSHLVDDCSCCDRSLEIVRVNAEQQSCDLLGTSQRQTTISSSSGTPPRNRGDHVISAPGFLWLHHHDVFKAPSTKLLAGLKLHHLLDGHEAKGHARTSAIKKLELKLKLMHTPKLSSSLGLWYSLDASCLTSALNMNRHTSLSSQKKKYEEEVAKGNELSTVRNKDKVISFEFTVISALIRAIH
ncbi:LOW QUALITY PROTEIN: hypothetical protein YC2023_104890 [Brassica napus]